MSTDTDIAGIQSHGLRQLGDFVLLEEIGRGGMGMVYRARQVSADREVALKVLPSFQGLDPDSVLRFQREAEAAGRLSHPGIVPVLAVGSLDGTYFYAMELVDGPSLFHLLDSLHGLDPASLENSIMEETAMSTVYPDLHERQLPEFHEGSYYPASCAALIMQVAGALHVAHQGKVVHRDLKPSNILLHPDGRPVLVDFGLARDQLAYSMTQTGDAVGTPAYMAPEQAAGDRDADARIDIYGLGATLYEMLTLQPPFVGNHSAEIMQAILDEDPTPPRRINPRIPRALETIVLCCLAKDPAARYSSAVDLQADLRAYLSGGKIRARREGLVRRARRQFERNRRAAFVASLSVMFAVLVGLMVGLVSLNNTRQEGRRTLEEGKILLIQGDVRGSHAAYAQAEVLLESPELVAAQRLADVNEVFERHYVAGRYRLLREFLRGLPADQQDRPEYHRLHRRLDGVGMVRLATPAPEGLEIYIRGFSDEGLDPAWNPLPADGNLAAGQYLLRLEAPEKASLLQAVRLDRDAEAPIDARLPERAAVPPGMVAVLLPDTGKIVAVARSELTIDRYADLLAGIKDRQLAAEMLPLRWLEESRSYMPVTGLSLRQARTAAAMLGAHLPSEREYLAAGNLGVVGLRFPWGPEWDVNRVVGDPRYTSQLARAFSKPEGASAAGVLHLVGNAAELLAPGPGQSPVLAGGHFLSAPKDLHLGARQRLDSVGTALPFAGMRLARFLHRESPEGEASAFAAQLAALRSEGSATHLRTWVLDATGQLRVEEDLAAPGADLRVPAAPRGFLARQPAELRNRQGNRLELSPAGGELLARIDPVDQGRRLQLLRELHSLEGLAGNGAGYDLRLPLRTDFEILQLPAGCRIDEVWPAPDWRLCRGGEWWLAWDRRETSRPEEAVIRLRRDGLLTGSWPTMQDLRTFVDGLFRALEGKDHKRLRTMLAPRCRLLPQGWSRDEWLRNLPSAPLYTSLRLSDVTAVGDILAVDLVVAWKTPPLVRVQADVKDWPLRLYLLRNDAGAYQLLQMGPRGSLDQGRIEGQLYRHQGLRVRVEVPEGSRLSRSAVGMTDLQLQVLPPVDQPTGDLPAGGGAVVQVVGCLGEVGQDEGCVRLRLLAGEEVRGRGERVSSPAAVPLGETLGAQVETRAEHWLIRQDDGRSWRRETWVFSSLGHRHLLLRWVAVGKSRNEARRAFRARLEWFQAVTAGLRIH